MKQCLLLQKVKKIGTNHGKLQHQVNQHLFVNIFQIISELIKIHLKLKQDVLNKQKNNLKTEIILLLIILILHKLLDKNILI